MLKMVDKYHLEEAIGFGSYGKVYRSRHAERPGQFAIKCIPQEKFRKVRKLSEFTQNEISVLQRLSHPNIVRFIEKLETQNNTYMVYELCTGGTLEKRIYERGHLPEDEALRFFAEVISAISLLDRHRIMHRDIKPSNIMLHEGKIKLGDFGFCKPLAAFDFSQTMVGSPIYMAPEVLRGQAYDAKADVWSLGVLLFEMFFGRCPYEEKTIEKLIAIVERQPLTLPRNVAAISARSEQLLRRMLVVDARRRASIREVQETLIAFVPYALELQRRYNAEEVERQRSSSRPPPIEAPSARAPPRPHSLVDARSAQPIAKANDAGPPLRTALRALLSNGDAGAALRELLRTTECGPINEKDGVANFLVRRAPLSLLLNCVCVVWAETGESAEKALSLALLIAKARDLCANLLASLASLEDLAFRASVEREQRQIDALCREFITAIDEAAHGDEERFGSARAVLLTPIEASRHRASLLSLVEAPSTAENVRGALLDALLLDELAACLGPSPRAYFGSLGRLGAGELRSLNAAKLRYVRQTTLNRERL